MESNESILIPWRNWKSMSAAQRKDWRRAVRAIGYTVSTPTASGNMKGVIAHPRVAEETPDVLPMKRKGA